MPNERMRRKRRVYRVPSSYVFTPNRDDVINSRLRLRYSSTCDTYYRDWPDSISLVSNNVMPGWEKGVFGLDSVYRNVDEEAGEVYFDRTKQSTTGNLKWKFDFSSSGLLVNEVTIRLNYLDSHGGEITTTIVGDSGKRVHYLKGGEYVTYSELENSSEIIIVVHFIGDTNQITKLFPQTIMGGIGYPMDIKILLKPPFESLGRPRVLLGLMYSSAQEIQVDSRHYKETGSVEACRGFLHVHIYEGKDLPQQRGKALDSSAKCYLLPTNKNVKCKSVSKKGGSPVWNEQFLIVGVGYTEIKKQAFEFCLVSKQKKSRKMIGGFRLSLGYRQIMAAQAEKANSVISKLLLKPLSSDDSKQQSDKTHDTGMRGFARLAIAMEKKDQHVQKNGTHRAQINGSAKAESSIKSVHPGADTSKAWKITSMDELRSLDRTINARGSQQSLDNGCSSVSKDTLSLGNDSLKKNDSLPNMNELSSVAKEHRLSDTAINQSSNKTSNNRLSLNINTENNGNPHGIQETKLAATENSTKLWLQRSEENRHCRHSSLQSTKSVELKLKKEENNNKEIDNPRLRSQSVADIPEDDHTTVSCSSALSRRWNSDRQIKKDEKKKKKTQLESILGEGLDEMTLDAVGLEVKQWENVVNRPKQWHYTWQILRKDMIPVHHCKT